MQKIKVGVFGGTGYTGLELIQILDGHPLVEIVFVTSESKAGESLRDSAPLAPDMILQAAQSADLNSVDCVFLCLPHTRSAPIGALAVQADVKVVDLSADLRIDDPMVYQHWYKAAHPYPDLLPVPYGLPELGRDALVGANVIANPGCYATTMLLGLMPLVRAGLILPDTPVIVDAKSGTSGAGRSPKQHILFGEVQGNFSPYNIGRAHRHLGEVEQVLGNEGFEAERLIFSPHLLPTHRGLLAGIYVQVADPTTVRKVFETTYANEPLIEVLLDGKLATLGHVVRTPRAVISLTAAGGTMIIMVAIDNLQKGSASQAVQNFNLMYQLPEVLGLLIVSEVSV